MPYFLSPPHSEGFAAQSSLRLNALETVTSEQSKAPFVQRLIRRIYAQYDPGGLAMKCPDTLRCEGCLEPCSSVTCEHCHWVRGTAPKSSNYLRPGTILQENYLLARVLGLNWLQRITYLAWDCNLRCKVAIKEYFPIAYGMRAQDRSTVITNSDCDSPEDAL